MVRSVGVRFLRIYSSMKVMLGCLRICCGEAWLNSSGFCIAQSARTLASPG